ncbi:Alpha/Beta hydrolase protein [Corynascus similis CBS 632.67]
MENPERGQIVIADLEAKFDRRDVAYKTVENTPIEAAIFIPKTLISSSEAVTAPVLVHFHGGGLITGAVPDPFFLVDWIRELAHSTSAIFVSAGYRLAPETPAVSILDDVADFWAWLHADFTAAIRAHFPEAPNLTPDLSRLAATGESAGGYLALQSALYLSRQKTTKNGGNRNRLRAVIAQYPALFTDLAAFNTRPEQPDPAMDALVDNFAGRQPGSVRVSAPWPGDVSVTVAALSNGRLRDLYGADPEGRLTLGYALERAEEVPPALWVVQGGDDTWVATAGADEMVERLRRERPKVNLKYTVVPGGWHGFDQTNKLEDDWVKEGVEFFNRFWLE